MASSSSSIAVAAALFCLLVAHGCCAKHKSHAHAHSPARAPATNASPSPSSSSSSSPSPSANGTNSADAAGWLNARATWYGAPNGAGPDDNGGACGFKNVNLPPFSAMTSCGNEPLFKDGKGCGSCYQVIIVY